MSIGERIKELRTVLSMSQQEFGERIGITKGTISLNENGKTHPSLRVIISICLEFNVNETWLRTGKGEMFNKGTDDMLVKKFHSLQLEKEEETVGARIQELRTLLGLSQQEFGKRIGITKKVVSYFEKGYHTTGINPSSKVIDLICQEFNVRKEWLRTGKGEIFRSKLTESSDQLTLKYQISDTDNMFIEKFLLLHSETKEETVGARIQELRTLLGLTQGQFGERIGIKENTVSRYETGKKSLTQKVVALICREFNVNETWLWTGIGEMSRPKPTDALDQLALKYQILDTDYVIIERFLSLRPEIRREMFDYLYEDVTTIKV